ncbi:hemicentin-2-like isoform X2 [Corticium candelabrum]|nr:hemicentin-2-like isoform X2 [Corticium candelabrum]
MELVNKLLISHLVIEYVNVLISSVFFIVSAQATVANELITVDVSLSPDRVPQGATPTFFCKVTGLEQFVNVKWLKDGHALPQDANRIRAIKWNGFYLLQIRYLESSDSGLYSCVASNADVTRNDSQSLFVIVPPVIQEPGSVTVIEGKPAVLYCNATSYLFIRWQHNGKYVDYYDEYHINTLGSHLTVRKATKKDAGTYVCIAYNERYNTRKTVELIVWEGKPEITAHPQKTYIPPLHTVVLVCQYRSEAPVHVEWYKHHRKIDSNSRTKFEIIPQQGKHRASLQLYNVSEVDAGEYHCTVINNVTGNCTESDPGKLRVSALLNKTEDINQYEVLYGGRRMLTCNNRGHQVWKVEWLLNNFRVDPEISPRYQTQKNGSLEIVDITYADELENISCIPRLHNRSLVCVEHHSLIVHAIPNIVRFKQLSLTTLHIEWSFPFKRSKTKSFSEISEYRVIVTAQRDDHSVAVSLPPHQNNYTISANESIFFVQVTTLTKSRQAISGKPIRIEMSQSFFTEPTMHMKVTTTDSVISTGSTTTNAREHTLPAVFARGQKKPPATSGAE